MKAETSSHSSGLTQATLLDPRPGTSFHFQIDSISTSRNLASTESKAMTPNGLISDGNLVEATKGLGTQDLTEEEINTALESVSEKDFNLRADQGIEPQVHFERATAKGSLVWDGSVSDLVREKERKEGLKKLGKPDTPLKVLLKREEKKRERKRKTYEYYEKQRKKAKEWGERT